MVTFHVVPLKECIVLNLYWVSVWGFLFLWVLGMGYVILLWHSLGLPYNYFIRFTRVCSHEDYFNARNKFLTVKFLKQGYRYHKRRKAFSKLFRLHHELVSKFSVGLKSLSNQGLSEPNFYGDLVHKFKTIMGRTGFSDQFRNIVIHHKPIGYNLNVM